MVHLVPPGNTTFNQLVALPGHVAYVTVLRHLGSEVSEVCYCATSGKK